MPDRTTRKLVQGVQREVLETVDLLPSRAADLLMELTALVGNCNDDIRRFDAEYAWVLLGFLESKEKANRAKIHAEISPEYERRQSARDTKELAIELVRSLKYFLKAKEEEMRLAR